MKEVWKDIPGYEGLYQASTFGRIKSLTKYKKVLTNYLQPNGYEAVQLYKNKTRRFCLVHRLVAKTFIPNPLKKPAVNHKDEIRNHNNVQNLEWVTNSENQNYGHCIERMAKSQGKPVCQYDLKGNYINTFYSGGDAERQTGINRYHISNVIHGRRKTAGGFNWKFLNVQPKALSTGSNK